MYLIEVSVQGSAKRVVAISANLSIAQEAYRVALTMWPDDEITLRSPDPGKTVFRLEWVPFKSEVLLLTPEEAKEDGC